MNKITKKGILHIVFIISYVFVLIDDLKGEPDFSLPTIMTTLILSLFKLLVPFILVDRIVFGKINLTEYNEFGLVCFPIVTFMFLFYFFYSWSFILFFKNNLTFLLKHRTQIEVIVAIIVAILITRKIFWFVFNKKDIDSDSNN